MAKKATRRKQDPSLSEDRARENWDRYVYMRDNGHLDFVKKADLCDRFFAGMQWEESVRRLLERQKRPVLTINKIFATMLTAMGEQLQNRNDVKYLPSATGRQETATALSKVHMHVGSANRLEWLKSELFADGSITSRGFLDLRLDFTDNMRGEARINLLNPRNVMIDPDAEEYDPDKWKDVIITKWLSMNDIELTYGKEYVEKLQDMWESRYFVGYDSIYYDIHNFSQGDVRFVEDLSIRKDPRRRKIRVIERQYREVRRVDHFVDLVHGDMRPVPPNWDPQKIAMVAAQYNLAIVKRPAEQIHWLVTADSCVLHDQPSPYKHLTPVPYFPIFRRGRTIGMTEQILSPQEFLNKSLSQELHIINTTANSGYKVRSGSLRNMDIEDLEQRGAETGIVIELDDVNNLEKIEPNQVPTGLDRVSFKCDNFIKEISGISDSQRGFDREDVAAKAIMVKQMRGSVNMAKPLDNLNQTDYILARNILDLVQTYYVEERVLQITSRDLNAEPERIAVNQVQEDGSVLNDLTVGEYQVVVTSVPARENYDRDQFNEVLQLRQLQVPIPDDVLIEYSHLDRKSEIAARIRGDDSADQQRQAQQMQNQLLQLEMQSKMVMLQKTMAEARLADARAQKALSEVNDGQQAPPLDPKILADLEKSREELEFRYTELQEKIALERDKLAQQAQIEDKKLDVQVASKDAELELQDRHKEVDVGQKDRHKDADLRMTDEHKKADLSDKEKDRKAKAKEKPKPKTK